MQVETFGKDLAEMASLFTTWQYNSKALQKSEMLNLDLPMDG